MKKILIANRGEIAHRIARTAKILGYKTVGLYSDVDRNSIHLKWMDEAIHLPGKTSQETYLQGEKIIEIAKKLKVDAIHPGFGFLSERAHFVKQVENAGMIFIGPKADSMEKMGDKISARNFVSKVGISGVPGSDGSIDENSGLQFAKKIGFPVLLKATAGGGGKGMRRVDRAEDFVEAFLGASREAKNAFGDGTMYLEKLVLSPHHVEVQVFGDGKGNAIHIGDRECSVQRRHQKVWEEANAPVLEFFPNTRKFILEKSVELAKSLNYEGAGTLEWIVGEDGVPYFLEMNTRLQVEHPVSEWISGIDFVKLQFLISLENQKLPSQNEIFLKGHSIEVRIYAEDSYSFLPAAGFFDFVQWPSGPFVRVDSGIKEKGEISSMYDPMIAKISVFGETRSDALGRMQVALDEIKIIPKNFNFKENHGLKTNIEFLRKLSRNKNVIEGKTTTDLISNYPDLTQKNEPTLEEALAIYFFENQRMNR